MIWLYSQEWFLNFTIFDLNMRDLFKITLQPQCRRLGWFLALFGIATDDGVMMLTYIKQWFKETKPESRRYHQATLDAAQRRIRPCLMTSATTIIALLPVLTSTGRF